MKIRALMVAVAATVGIGVSVTVPSPALAAGENTGAYGVFVDLDLPLGVQVDQAPTPTANLANPSASVASVTAPPVLSSGTITVAATSTPTASAVEYHADAAVQSLAVTIGLLTITAGVVTASCDSTSTVGGTPVGSASLANVALIGVLPVTVPLNPAPNTEIPLAVLLDDVATLVLNEQVVDPVTGALTVNALHLKLPPGSPLGTGDLIVSSVTCDAATPLVEVPLVSFEMAASMVGLAAVAWGAVVIRRRRRA